MGVYQAMLKIMILGATSAIAHETARNFAKDGAEFFLVARDQDKLMSIVGDLQAHGAKKVITSVVDMNDTDRHAGLIDEALTELCGLDAVLLSYGTLGDQAASEASYDVARQELETNFLSTVSFLTVIANVFEKQRRGVIAVVTSVAGDRGRASNYVYGTAQAAKITFLSGLRNRLAKSGVTVLTIKPGQTDTPMTAHMDKGLLWAQPSTVGRDIYNAMRKQQDVLYTPFFWRYIMGIILHIPEQIFKRLSL